jgi:hypothetical protein
MAAGLGFKTFTTGEVLTAADTNGYLMQGILVFATSTARDAAITSPQEGQFAYLKDTNVTTYYTGSAWANLDTTGMTNPMTTTGDTIYSSSGSTPARLGIGSTGNVLTVAGGVPTWAAPSGGAGLTLLSTTTLSGASTTVSSISQAYTNLYIYAYGLSNATANGQFRIAPNGATLNFLTGTYGGALANIADNAYITNGKTYDRTTTTNNFTAEINFYSLSVTNKPVKILGYTDSMFLMGGITFDTTAFAINSLTFTNSGGNWSGGTVKIYGA